MQNLTNNPFICRYKSKQVLTSSPLAGLKLAVKDLFDIVGMPTTAGNPTWANTHQLPKKTASAVQILLDNGAELIGKTITDELAYSLNGINIHYGTPRNPISPDRLTGGSSSGSAAAVAAHLADIGLGTDTGGSIRVPASYTGLFGLRTTHGLVERDHMVALAPSFDTVGWMTQDLSTLASIAKLYLSTEVKHLQPVNFYVADNLIQTVGHAGALTQYLHASGLRPGSASNLLDEKTLEDASSSFRVLQGHEIWTTHGDWIKNHNPSFAEDIQARFDWCAGITAEQVLAAKQQQEVIRAQLESILDTHHVILLPTTPGPAPLLNTSADALADYRNKLLGLTALAGLCGLPQLHIPLPNVDSAPCGFSLIGAARQDLFLLDIAKYYFTGSQHAQ